MNNCCQEMCVLVRNIVDTAHAHGRDCCTDVTLHGSVLDPCTEFLSATAGPCVTLRNATAEPMRNRSGLCIRADVIVPITVLLCANGCKSVREGSICLNVEGIMRNAPGGLPELVAQANVCVRRGCIKGGVCRLWVDYTVEIFGICMRAVRIPVLGACDMRNDSCQPFFDLPLYPRGMDGH